MKLYIGNKNYSSWSMRAWVLLTAFDIPFDEVNLRFDSFAPDSDFKKAILPLNPVGTVPVLLDGDIHVIDTLAIAEYVHETVTPVWPEDKAERAQARNLCAVMHSGFSALRQHCLMNIEADLKDVGAKIWKAQSDVRADIALLEQMLGAHISDAAAGPLFGRFGAVDAFYAPVIMRLNGYGLPVSARLQAYADFITGHGAVRAWCDAARDEHDFLDFEEPHRTSATEQNSV